LKATIPVAQYANIQPEIEGFGATPAAARQDALNQLKVLWDLVGERPLDIDRNAPAGAPAGKILTCWASGNEVFFDPVEHVYRGADGVKWLGGSTFAGRYQSEFNTPVVSKKVADKYGVKADEVVDMWALNRDASATVGTAVHMALQLRGEYAELSRATKEGSVEAATSSNPILRPIVEKFYEIHGDRKAKYECFVADPARRHCGQIDRLEILDDGSVIVDDFKTNIDIHKSETIKKPFKGLVPNSKLGGYWLQLSFYARILIVHGVKVKGLRVHHWTGETWESYEHDVIDIDGIIKAHEADE
jgi:hypothetical protein